MAERPVAAVRRAFHTVEGDGIDVLRAIPAGGLDAVGPFIFLDHFGPITVRPGEAKGASAHPHAGIETLTLLLEGRFRHKDSLGNVSAMEPGEVQWMRAGRGIIHDEGPDEITLRDGGAAHGVQLWINMPKGGKQGEPGYRHVKAAEIPAFQSGGARVRVIAGEIGGRLGPVATAGAPTAVQVSFGTAGGRIVLAPERAEELAAYVLTGAAAVGPAGTRLDAGTLAALGPGEAVRLSASGPAELLLVGVDPLDAPILRYGPFVMNSPDELERAIADYQAGRMGRIAA